MFTRDQDFFKRGLCHAAYGLVWLDAAPAEAAMFILRFLKHRRFDSKAKRMGIVARVHHDGIQFWRHGQPRVQREAWLDP